MRTFFTIIAVFLLLVAGSTNAQFGPSPWTAASGTYTVPAGVTTLTIECRGAGGGGGGSRSDSQQNFGSAGGGGGGAYSITVVNVTPGETIVIAVGNGGAGGNGNNDGLAGGTSTITYQSAVVASAAGGAGGGRAASTSANVLGSGGAGASAGTGTVTSGGNGGNGAQNGSFGFGGGGGGGAGTISNGSNGATYAGGPVAAPPGGTGGIAGGGNGGNGYQGNSGGGQAGAAPGGGGGGSAGWTSSSRTGGAGGAGRIVITYCALPAPGATTGPTAACGPVTLGLENIASSVLPGITFQWQASTTGDVDANYAPTGGAAATYDAIVGVPTWFRCRVECSSTGEFTYSTPLLVSLDPPNAGTDATLTVCNTAQPENMFDLLGPDAEAGGIWSGPSPVSDDLFNPATMVGGTYVYTVTGTAPCPSATAVVSVVVDPCLGIADMDAQHGLVWLGQEADGSHVVRSPGHTILNWQVIDVSGRTLLESSVPAHHDLVRIPMASEKPGIYVLRIISNDGLRALRVRHMQ